MSDIAKTESMPAIPKFGAPPAESLPPPIVTQSSVPGGIAGARVNRSGSVESSMARPSDGSSFPASPASSSSSSSVDMFAGDEKLQRMRTRCLEELIETEGDYLQDMEVLSSVFLFPMQAMKMVEDDELRIIKSNVEDVIPIHQAFHEQLQQRYQEAKAANQVYLLEIGDILKRFTHYFKLYSIYTENQANQLAKLDECQKRIKTFDRFLQVCHSDAKCKGLMLNAFLIKPVQRLCKYPLLLRELIKNTPEAHPDYEPLNAAKAKIESVVGFVNEAKRIAEGQAKMREIEAEVGIRGLATPDRFFHREGELMMYRGKGKSLQPRYLFLFNDLILLMQLKKVDPKTKKMHYEMRGRADLDRAKVVNLSDENEMGNIKNAFELQLKDTKFVLCAKSDAEKRQWLGQVKANVKEYQKIKFLRAKREKDQLEQRKNAATSSGIN